MFNLFTIATHFLTSQFRSLPQPSLPASSSPHTPRTIIITGANSGLGLEAARHYARLLTPTGGRIILACRSTARGEAARDEILQSLPDSDSGKVAIEVWPLDLCSFDSVRAFCKRADAELERVDVLLMNAAVMADHGEVVEGWEMTVMVNVLATFLMVVMMLPVLKRTARVGNEEGVVTVVGSEAHFFAKFSERLQPRIFEAFRTTVGRGYEDRYGTSKLIDILVARELADRLDAAHGGESPVVVNIANPGLCKSSLFRNVPVYVQFVTTALCLFIGRTSEQGARALLAATTGGRESHGQYVDSGKVDDPSPFVLSPEGKAVQKRVWDELMEILEGIEPGVTSNITSR